MKHRGVASWKRFKLGLFLPGVLNCVYSPCVLVLLIQIQGTLQVDSIPESGSPVVSGFPADNVHTRQTRGIRPDLKYIQAKFREYEECMDKHRALKRKFYNNFIKAKIFMEGQTVKLSSMICSRPDQNLESYNVRWYRLLPSNRKLVRVKIDSEKFIMTPNKTLLVTRVTVDDAGQYVCYKHREHTAVYMVDVVRGEQYRSVVKPPDKGNRPVKRVRLRKNNLELRTTWSQWSRCSVCNKRGQHRRLGFCTLRKLYTYKKVKPRDISWLTQFEEGLPCRSTLLPEEIKSIKEIRRRQSESMVAHCFEPCPTLPPVKVYTDAMGEVVETVKVGEGMISMKEGKPEMPKMVKRKMIYEKKGKRIKLECPHEHQGDILVRWQNGSQTLNALLIKRQTRARVVITAQYHLAIRKLRTSDTAAYSCWVNGVHIATIKIRVTDKMRRDYKDYILFGGFGAVGVILFCIFCGVCCAQRNRSLR